MKKLVTAAAFRTLQTARLFSIFGRTERRRRQLVILCYHGVSLADEHIWRPDMFVSPENFRARLSLLKSSGANVLPLSEALVRLRANSLPPRSVALTFDDGFVDFGAQAAPALLAHGFPATVYIATHYSSYPFPVSNLMIDYLLWKSGAHSVRLSEFGIEQSVDISSRTKRAAISQQISRCAAERGFDTRAKNEMLWMLAERLGVDYQQILDQRLLQILNGEEVSRLSAAGFDFELHTHRHCTPDTAERFEKEIKDNRSRILEFTGEKPRHFCYPSGNYSPRLRPWLAQCEIVSATTCEFGLVQPSSDPFRLPRLLDHNNWSLPKFEGMIAGFVV